ncbi:bifunctional helix-turn-helix transcriptional regulator/GNAT family N-acetyltransferase [Kosakonia sp. BYX6]|uniref:Bifunctional helix-turn-helix transcriptional regulator/GNAT family N-acetyltransferase n=1 Tax=Kosakonia calanthes TaxID=3139408 RepID=A0ABZ3B5F6_9ENTR
MDILSDMPYAFLGSRLKRLAEQMQAEASALVQNTGIHVPPGLYPVLMVLDKQPGLTISELARYARVSQPAMTSSINRLIRAGLVRRQSEDNDRRKTFIRLTAAGKTAIVQGEQVAWPLLGNVVQELTAGLSGNFIEQITQIEKRLAERSLPERGERYINLDLRPMAENEIPAVVSLLNRAYRSGGEEAGWTTEAGLLDGERMSEQTLREELADKPHATVLVWKTANGINGCVWVEPVENDVWYLGSLAITPSLQNAQYGRRLLAAAEQWCRLRGGKTAQMTVLQVRDSLIAWYLRRGYRRTGETEPFPTDDTRFGIPTQPGLLFDVLTKSLV